MASAPAFTPVVHVRADGRIGVLHYDLRSNTPDAATLLADAWLVTSADGVQWSETHMAGPFDMTQAPNAGGLFLGDYQGLASSGSEFVALLATANLDTTNRSDVHAVRRDPDATAARAPRFGARATVAPLSQQAAVQFDAAQHEATLAAMERRIAD
jgi:hypothetical protein